MIADRALVVKSHKNTRLNEAHNDDYETKVANTATVTVTGAVAARQ